MLIWDVLLNFVINESFHKSWADHQKLLAMLVLFDVPFTVQSASCLYFSP